jgi:hypothetical protein
VPQSTTDGGDAEAREVDVADLAVVVFTAVSLLLEPHPEMTTAPRLTVAKILKRAVPMLSRNAPEVWLGVPRRF